MEPLVPLLFEGCGPALRPSGRLVGQAVPPVSGCSASQICFLRLIEKLMAHDTVQPDLDRRKRLPVGQVVPPVSPPCAARLATAGATGGARCATGVRHEMHLRLLQAFFFGQMARWRFVDFRH